MTSIVLFLDLLETYKHSFLSLIFFGMRVCLYNLHLLQGMHWLCRNEPESEIDLTQSLDVGWCADGST